MFGSIAIRSLSFHRLFSTLEETLLVVGRVGKKGNVGLIQMNNLQAKNNLSLDFLEQVFRHFDFQSVSVTNGTNNNFMAIRKISVLKIFSKSKRVF